MKRSVLVIALVALAASFAVAQGTVSAYTTLEEPLAKALFDEFTAQTGIAVSFVRLSGGEVVARLEAEKANPQASIWVGGVGLDHITAKGKGLTAPYKSRVAGKTPTEYKDKEGYWIGMYVGPLTFVTNTKRAAELGITPPTSWADLLKPEYKGLIRAPNPNTSGTAYNMIITLRYLYKGDEDKVFDYLKKLDANIDQYTKSGSAPGKSVAIGEIPVAIGYAHDQVKLKVEGAPVVINAPKEGTGYELASMSLVAGGKDAVNAKKLYDWILSNPAAQEKFVKYYVVLVANGAAKHPDALSIKEIKTVKQDFTWDGDAENRARLLKRWTDEIGSKR
ncbi:MAG: iron ABC transporter substrate-binding protein [Spirochaetae bacterium HGW-Spirochaetae-7]|jgi:iron(III) transport system substrate-binding protein|nr:MAG: iron ABC transporter substrate-binding protein [Spirochaetae bacterium HGW-Spirochaetae-7]